MHSKSAKPHLPTVAVAVHDIATVIAAGAAMGERILQNGADLKSENDLTV
ncbi:hypothetical protein ACIGKR_30375 [Rhodococcus qingshengii]